MGRIQLFVRSADPGAAFVPSGSPFHTCLLGATIVRRRLIEKIGGFNPDMRYGEDVDWFLRARESGAGIANLPGVALYYRRHRLDAAARDIVSQKSRTGLLDAFHRSLQRKRSVSPPAQGRPLVSVVIPVFNGEAFIAAAVESVLAQDYRPLEVIVADDGSTDRTREIVATFPLVSLLALEHRSAGAARNAGVRAAKGQVIAFLDADDLWLPEKISRQMEALIADPALEAVFAHLQEFREEGAEAKDRSRPGLTPATMLIRRAAFTRIGWFSEEESALEGVDWQLRASEESLRTLMLPDVLYRRRIHGKNRSIVDRDLNGYIRALKASLDRRRRSADVTPHVEGS
jgi:GT2 family glycosyltransferase